MTIPIGDFATTNFAFGGLDNQYIYLEGATSGAFWRFKAHYPGQIGPGVSGWGRSSEARAKVVGEVLHS